MKILAPSMQNLGGGGSSSVAFPDMNNVVYSNTRPNNLENGLWIKNNTELPLMIVDSWKKLSYNDTSEIKLVDKNISNEGNNINQWNYAAKLYFIDENVVIIFYYDYIYRYDISTNTITNYNSSMASTTGFRFVYNYSGYNRIGNKFYIFGGYTQWLSGEINYIAVYDYDTNTITKLSATLPKCLLSPRSDTYNNRYVLIFGGYTTDSNSPANQYISKLDTNTNTLTNIYYEDTLPSSYVSKDPLHFVSGDYLYLLGGYNNESSSSTKVILVNNVRRFNINGTTSQIPTTKSIPTDILEFYNKYSPQSYQHTYYLNDRIIGVLYTQLNQKFIQLDSSLSNWCRSLDTVLYNNKVINNGNTVQYTYKDIYYLFYNSQYYICLSDTYNNKIYWFYGNNGNPQLIEYDADTLKNDGESLNEPVKFYPILINTISDNIGLDANILQTINLAKDDNLIARSSKNMGHSLTNNIIKVYKPDYSGEEQEAWIVRNGVWKQIQQIEEETNTVFSNKPVVICTKQLSTNEITGEYDAYFKNIESFRYQDAIYYVQQGTNKVMFFTYNSTTTAEIYLKASIIAGFNDNVTFNSQYACNLIRNVAINTNYDYYVSNTYIFNNEKYILLYLYPGAGYNYKRHGYSYVEIFV